MDRIRKRIPAISCVLFLLSAAASVIAAWAAGAHRSDFSISFSSYIGLYRPVSVMYFIVAAVILPMLAYYTVKTVPFLLKRILYAAVMLCIFGAALFPFNYYSAQPTPLTIDLHNWFAIALMLVTTASFLLTAVTAKHRIQRLISVFSLLYAAAFIVLYAVRFQPMFRVFFFCESFFILLLLLGLHMEQYGGNEA